MNNTNRKIHHCPHCNAVWSEDEVFAQECLACGYPDNDNDSTLNIWEPEEE